MTSLSVLAAGAVLGVRHALEADHLAAVTTLVDEGSDRAGVVGASWGVGHSLPILLLGVLFVTLGVRLPDVVVRLFEGVVGLVLVLLGARMLLRVVRGTRVVSHAHGSKRHAHLTLGDRSLGPAHSHLHGGSFLVGVLHGFAGSGALVVLLVSSAPSVSAALVFLAGFCCLSVLTMALVSALWGRTLGTALRSALEGIAGLLGVAVGTLLVAEQVAASGLF